MNELFPKSEPKFNGSNNKKYKVEVIKNSTVYIKGVKKSTVYIKGVKKHLLGLYYLISWKDYPEKEIIWELSLRIIHFWKIIFTFHKN